jgi:ElaB/YqjD/DUF883 family membrane-anchored ribosome-binding protein
MATETQGSNGHGASSIVDHLNTDEAQQMFDQSRAAMEQAVDKAGDFIRERPLVCLAGALAVGYLIGKIVSR